MAERITQDRRFKAAVESVKDSLTRQVMHVDTNEEGRNRALLKFHLVDEIVAALASAEHQ